MEHTGLGERVVYVAGDRVTGDIMSKPFSMGRNLLCIFSKKHMVNDDSTTKYV
jgi:glycerol-3-phosphate O-acyltransferase